MLITNLTSEKMDKKLLTKIAEAVLLPENEKKFAELSVVLADEAKIREINRKYRKKNKPTDVLSFPELSEIFICPAFIQRRSKTLKNQYKAELTHVLLHGILHLLGFDHAKKNEAARMQKKEEEILKKISAD
jgi:probable rRNA maturation factor